MTHDELVQHAVDWLRSRGKQQPHGQHSVVFAELSTIVTSETPDAIGWNAGGVSTLVECKTSRTDFLRDRKKFARRGPCQLGRRRYYLVPEGCLILATEVSESWGLLVLRAGRVHIERRSEARELSEAEQRCEAGLLAAAVRRHEAGVPWDPKRARFGPYHQRRKGKT